MKRPPARPSARRSIVRYIPFALGAVVLVIGVSLVVHARFVGAAGGSGTGWQLDGLSGATVHYLAVGSGPTPPVFAATESGVYRRDGAGNWTRVLASPGVWSVDLLPDNRTVVAGDQGGQVVLSSDAGATWRAARVTHDAVYAVRFVGRSRAVILAGAAGGLFRSEDGGASWVRRLTLHQSAVSALTASPTNGQTLYAGAVAGAAGGATGVYISRDAGQTWSPYGTHLQSGGGIMSLALTGGNHLLAGTMGQAIWTVGAPAAPWLRLGTGVPRHNDHVAGIALVPDRPGTAYIGTLGLGVFRTRDAGKHWTGVSDGLRGAADAMLVLAVVYDPSHHRLFAGTSSGVYRLAETAPATAGPAY